MFIGSILTLWNDHTLWLLFVQRQKTSAASSGNNKGQSFNLSNQESYQGLAEDASALLIKAEQLTVHHHLCFSYSFPPCSPKSFYSKRYQPSDRILNRIHAL